MKTKLITTTRILWLVYLALLAVLLPHTAWAFDNFEPSQDGISWVAWIGAFAFEAAIAALTHKLSKHIEQTSNRIKGWRRFSARYLNAYSLGLVASIGVSSLANLAHAVEFGGSLTIFVDYPFLFGVYTVAFGAILPFVSLLFARVLSNVVETETEVNPELIAAKETIKELRTQVRELTQERNLAVQRFEGIGDLAAMLFGTQKQDKILAASQLWPELPSKSISIIADSSPSYVSEVINKV